MYNESTPYTLLKKKYIDSNDDQNFKIKEYFKRDGVLYSYGGCCSVFSAEVLKSFESALLEKSVTFYDLIALVPWEFQWYGEYVMNKKPYEIVLNDGNLKVFAYQKEYNESRKIYTLKNLRDKGYKVICMQAGWVKESEYKHSSFIRFYRAIEKFKFGFYERNMEKKLNKRIETYCKRLIRTPIREFLREV